VVDRMPACQHPFVVRVKQLKRAQNEKHKRDAGNQL